LKSNPTWGAVPYWNNNGTYVYQRETVGLGDPCIYYFSNPNKYDSGGWRLPIGNSYNNALSSFYAYPETGYPYGNYNTGYRDKYPTNLGMFYPNTGMRKSSGGDGQIEQYLYGGLYWSSTSDGGTYSYYLYFNKYDNKFEYSGHWEGGRAGAVRCFPQ
jgi:hypothetical protein